MANNALKHTGYSFERMTKEEVFQAWEHFLNEEKTRKYSPCMDFDCGCCQSYISNYKAFGLFVNNVLNGFLGTVKQYCKTYGVSEDYFTKAHEGEYTVISRNNWLNEETITENEIAAIFKIAPLNCSLNWCEIVQNFTLEEGCEKAVKSR